MINSRFILSLAALYAERAGDGGEDGDDEVDDGFDVFFFHTIWDDWWLMIGDWWLMIGESERDREGHESKYPYRTDYWND